MKTVFVLLTALFAVILFASADVQAAPIGGVTAASNVTLVAGGCGRGAGGAGWGAGAALCGTTSSLLWACAAPAGSSRPPASSSAASRAGRREGIAGIEKCRTRTSCQNRSG